MNLGDGDQETKDTVTMLVSVGGLGLRSALRTNQAAYWASWADCLAMVRERHPAVTDLLVHQLENHPHTPHLQAAVAAARELTGVYDFEPPSWHALVE